MKIFKEKVYPPNKLVDKTTIHGLTFHLDFLKTVLWLKHFERLSDKPIITRETKTRTVYPN
jgi:hypothetical protein